MNLVENLLSGIRNIQKGISLSWKDIFENSTIRNLLFLLVVVSMSLFGIAKFLQFYESEGWSHDVLVEAHGMLFDIAILGILATALNSRDERAHTIQRYNEEIEDFLGWNSEEAAYRISGNIRRINRLGAVPKNLSRAYLKGIDLSEANLYRANLEGANLSGANLRGANLDKAALRGANLVQSHIDSTTILDENFLLLYSLVNGGGTNRELRGVDLASAYLVQADLQGANLSGADLQGANLSWAVLNGADLSYAKLNSASIGAAELNGTNLSHAILVEADLSHSSLNKADLRYADLSRTKLFCTKFQEAFFEKTKLCNASFDNTNLSGVDLKDTVIDGSTLIGTNFSHANITRTSIENTHFNGKTNLTSTRLTNNQRDKIEDQERELSFD